VAVEDNYFYWCRVIVVGHMMWTSIICNYYFLASVR
jgi:hypothetical protein